MASAPQGAFCQRKLLPQMADVLEQSAYSAALSPLRQATTSANSSPTGLDLRSGFMAAPMSFLLLQIGNRPGLREPFDRLRLPISSLSKQTTSVGVAEATLIVAASAGEGVFSQ
jgi:hypothetical protein